MSDPKRTRLVFLGFPEEHIGLTVMDVIETGARVKSITVDDWAMISKAPGGKVTITDAKKVDPGGARGALFGGGAGMVLASLAGPLGLGTVIAGAAIGAVTAAVRDSGLKNEQLAEVSKLMADGRTGVLVAVPLDAVDAWEQFVATHVEFQASDRHYEVDIVPGRDFEQAIEEYRRAEEP